LLLFSRILLGQSWNVLGPPRVCMWSVFKVPSWMVSKCFNSPQGCMYYALPVPVAPQAWVLGQGEMVCKRVGQSSNAPFAISMYVSLFAVCKHHSEVAKARRQCDVVCTFLAFSLTWYGVLCFGWTKCLNCLILCFLVCMCLWALSFEFGFPLGWFYVFFKDTMEYIFELFYRSTTHSPPSTSLVTRRSGLRRVDFFMAIPH
jgi:hypothetical protein